MPRSTLEYLRHIRDEAEYILRATNGITKDQFLADDTLRRAIVRSIEIMGEATKHVPAAYRDGHPDIPWRSISGMRDRLIHGYIDVDYDIVWDVVTSKVPGLSAQLRCILGEDAK
jgi:uncharacterized protein with HEPN domain